MHVFESVPSEENKSRVTSISFSDQNSSRYNIVLEEFVDINMILGLKCDKNSGLITILADKKEKAEEGGAANKNFYLINMRGDQVTNPLNRIHSIKELNFKSGDTPRIHLFSNLEEQIVVTQSIVELDMRAFSFRVNGP